MIRYPAHKIVDATSSSDLCLRTTRKINSASAVDDAISRRSNRHVDDNIAKKIETPAYRRRHPPLNSSPSSTGTTDAARQIVDISDLDYKAYRHQLIEASLRKQYDNYQPPGDVVLNSLHLNSADSVIGVRLNDHNLFDFVEEYYDASKATSRQDGGHQSHPLDHFLVRGAKRPKTAERQTETLLEDDVDCESLNCEGARDNLSANADGGFPRSPGTDNNGNPRARSPARNASIEGNVVVESNDLHSSSEAPRERAIPTQSRAHAFRETSVNSSKEDRTRRKSLWSTKNRSASAGSASTPSAPRILALPRAATLPENRGLIKSPRRRTSAGRLSGSAKKLEDHPDKPAQSSSCKQTAREEVTANFFSRSSSEIVSVCSERRDEMSCRSRESSISPKRRARPPWLSGDRGKSFNRKYGNIAKDSSGTGRPISARGNSLPRKFAIPSGGRSSKESSPAPTSHKPTLLGPRVASFIEREKERIRVSGEEEREQGRTATSPRQQRDELRENAGSVENDGKQPIPRTAGSPDERISASKPAISRFPNNATSFPSPRSRTRASTSSKTSAKASATAKSTTTSRTSPAQKTGLSPPFVSEKKQAAPKNTSGYSKSPLKQARAANTARLNRGEGQHAANSALAKGAPLNSKIELSGQVLNSVGDTDDERGVAADCAKLAKRVPQVSPTRENAEATGSDGDEDARAVSSVKNAEEETATAKNDVSSNNSGRDARSKVSEITRDLRAGSAGGEHSSTARRNANSETKSGLKGARLNGRSNDALGGMKRDESSAGSAVLREDSTVNGAKARERCTRSLQATK